MLWTTLGLTALASTTPSPGVHMLHTLNPPAVRLEAPPPVPSKGVHTATVYGYLQGNASTVSMVDLDSLTHVAWHAVGWDSSGNITNTSSWEAVAPTLVSNAHAVGTRVHLNLMPENATHAAVLSNATRRANAVTQLAALINDQGADGISIDIEGMHASLKADLVSFTQEMQDAVDEVIVATPLKDWNGAYDYDELAAASDGLFIMGYDAHGPWEDSGPGPISMMDAGLLWPEWTLPHSLNEEYRTWGAPDDKLIMGLPLYGGVWNTPSEDYPAITHSFHNHWAFSTLLDNEPIHGRRFEEFSVSAWMWDDESLRQIWYDDPETLEVKMSWALDEGIQGIGFWEVSYATGEPDFWELVDDLTMTDEPTDTGSPPEDTGTPEDTGDGPIDDDDTADDSGDVDSGSSDLDANADEKAGCGCSASPSNHALWWAILPMIALLRRQN